MNADKRTGRPTRVTHLKTRRPLLRPVETLEDRTTPVAFPLGSQFTVTPALGSEAGPSAVAVVTPAGDFVAVWESLETDGSGVGVYAQRFEADGDRVGTPALVNTTTAGNQSRPAIATDGSGKVVIAWQGEGPAGGAYDIFYRTGDFATAGDGWLGATEARVNVETAGSQAAPTAAMDRSGNFVIAWQSDANRATTGLDVVGRYGTLSGGLGGAADTVLSAGPGDERSPDAAMAATAGDGSGSIIVAWTGPGPAGEEDEATNVVRGTVFGYDGAFATITPTDTAHTNYQLTAAAQHDQVNPGVAMAADGRFVLVWQAEGGQGTGSDIFSRRFLAGGNGVGTANDPVNTTVAEPQRSPSVGIDAAGNYLVAWQTQGQDARSWGIVARAFNADGTEAKGEYIVNINEQGPQTSPAVGVYSFAAPAPPAAPAGPTVVAWSGPFVPTHGSTGGHGEEEEGVEGEGGHQPAVFAHRSTGAGTVDVTPSATALNVNGLEFQLAAVGAGEDVPAAAAAGEDGNYLVVWQSFEEPADTGDPSGFGVYAQRVAPDGTPIGPRLSVNTATLGYQSAPSVAALPGNRFVIVWQGEVRSATPNGPAQYDLFARVFAPDATDPTLLVGGAEFLITTPTSPTTTTAGHQTAPSVAADAAGNFVVVWQTHALVAAPTEDLTEVYARRFSTAGSTAAALGGEFRVNTQTATAQVGPKVAMNAAGQFAVAWVSDHPSVTDPNDTEKSIFVRWFGADGVAPNPEFPANVYTKDAQERPSIGIDAAGNLVVAWQSINQEAGGTGVSWGVFARQFRPDGSSPQAQEFQVNETVAAPQRFASVGVAPDGYFAIAWQSINQDGSSWGVFQRQYRPNGVPETVEQLVNTVTSGPQIQPVIARKGNGDYAVFWSGTAADHVDGISGRANRANTAPHGKLGGVSDREDAGPRQVDLFAAFGDDYDADAALTYVVVGNTNPALFSGAAIDPATGRLTLAYAPDASGAADVTVRVTDTYGLFTDVTFAVVVAPVADAPALTASNKAGGERQAIPLGIAAAAADIDGSEAITSVVVAGVPAGVVLSAGTDLGGGRWSLTPGQLANLTLTSPVERTITLSVTATAAELSDGSTATTTQTVQVVAAPVADRPSLAVPDRDRDRDQLRTPERDRLRLNIAAAPLDADGTETVAVLIAGVPADATLSAGTRRADGVWVLTPAQLAGLTITRATDGTFDLTVTAVATEAASGEQATTTAPSFPVTFTPVADRPGLIVRDQDRDRDQERQSIPLVVTAAPFDADGTERVVSVLVEGVPAGGVLSAGVDLGGGRWSLTADQLAGLTITLPHEMTVTLTVTATAAEQADGTTATTTRSVTLTARNVDYYAVGAGSGGGPVVKLYDLDGTVRSAFMAYDPSFRGGANVAVGDVTGDGIPDVATAPGTGGGPHVKVFDGKTGTEVRGFMAYDPSFRGGVNVAVGDVTGDGVEDVVTAPGAGGGPHIRVYDGATGALVREFMAYDPSFRGGVNVTVGDLDGDGFAEIVTGAGEGGGPHVQVFSGKTGDVIHSFMAGNETGRGGAYVVVGNVQGDGRLDVVTGTGAGTTARVTTFDGHDLSEVSRFDAFEPTFTCGVRVGAVDLDGDGRDEVLLGPCADGGPRVRVVDGVTGDMLDDFFAFDPAFLGGVAVGG